MKKVFFVLAAVMLITTAATMTMAATLAEWNFGMATYVVDTSASPAYYKNLPIDGSLLSTARTEIRSAPKVPPIDLTLANWEQAIGVSGAADDFAMGWLGKSGAQHILYTGLTTPYSESTTSNKQKSNWFTAERQTMTISAKIRFNQMRYPYGVGTSTGYDQNQMFSIGFGWSGGMAEPTTGQTQNLFHVNAAVFAPRYPDGGTNPGGSGNTATVYQNLSDYVPGVGTTASTTADRILGPNAAVTSNTSNTGTRENVVANWRGYAGLSIMKNDVSQGTPYMSKFAERGGFVPLPAGWVEGDPIPAPIPADPNAIPIAANGLDGIADNADDWYLYTMTVDFSAGSTATYNVYLNNVLQATLTQNLPLGKPEGEFWTVRELKIGSNGYFTGSIDDLKVTDTIDPPVVVPPAGAVTGTVDLQGWSGAKLGEAVAVTITDASSNSETLNTTLDSNGGYSVTTTLRGTCYVSAKCSHWLSDGKEAVVDANGAAAVDFSMINGDCNNDNGVDEGDFGLLSAAWYSSDGEPSFDSRADLNGDGGIDEGDFGLLSAAWYQSGI